MANKYAVKTIEGILTGEDIHLGLKLGHGGSIIDIEMFHATFVVSYYESEFGLKKPFILTNNPKDIEAENPPVIRLRRFYAGKMYYLIEV